MKQWQKYAAEILGTFVLVFGGCLSIIMELNPQDLSGGVLPLWPALGFGFALMAGLYAFAEVSGGHFNPAVSLAMFIDRRLKLDDLVGYWLAQFLGAILATLVLRIGFSQAKIAATATVPSSDGSAFLLEIVLTAVFVAVILQSTKTQRYAGTALVAIPLTLLLIHMAAVPVSGASVNPARTIASALVGNHWDSEWIYLVGPPLGAILGWAAHRIVVHGDTNLKDDLQAAAADVQAGVEGKLA